MKEEYIKKFWTKLYAGSKSINKIPYEYLQESYNARVFDWWIGCRKWKQLILDSQIWTNNKGGFLMWLKLYQITNSWIYLVNKDTWVQTLKASLDYNQVSDVLVYKDFAIIVSNKQDLQVFNWESLETQPTTVPFANTWIIEYTRWYSFLVWWSGLQFTIDQSTTDIEQYFWNNINWELYWEYLKQGFTISAPIENIDITLYLGKIWTPTDDINVWIYQSSDDTLIWTTTIDWSTLTTSTAETFVTIAWSLTLLTDSAYYFKIERSTALDDDNYYMIASSELDVYTWGAESLYQNNIIIDQPYNSNTTIFWADWSTIDRYWIIQTFTINSTITNPFLDIDIRTYDTPLVNVTAWIYRSSDDVLIDEVIMLKENFIVGAFAEYNLSFTCTLTDTSSEAYYFKIQKEDRSISTTQYFQVYTEKNSTSWYIKKYEWWKAFEDRGSWYDIDWDITLFFYENSKSYVEKWDVKFLVDAVYTTPWVTWSLFISVPITPTNPEYAYDFTWVWSEQITFDETIVGLEWTMNWIYIFCTNRVDFLWANSLQNVAWSATFITTPLWKGWTPINNHCIASSWDKIFYITKNLQLQTVNYIAGTDSASLWTLSTRPIVWIKKFLDNLDENQLTAYWFYNKNDETMQFHLRTVWASYNDVCLVYDMINDTFTIDTGKNYNYVVQDWYTYFGFSDTDSSIYKDEVQSTDNGTAIPFSIKTQAMNYWNLKEKMFWWILVWWGIWEDTTLNVKVNVDWEESMSEDIDWETGDTNEPFERIWDEAQMYELWTRAEIEISSDSDEKDFIIDTLWLRIEHTWNFDTSSKF